ncbi:hypothetical protein ACFPMF_07330 [Larkinella bovis]|uniref:Uncharacterized protein n=1 Tax=Larkinella bovis TaxID=683041 RepID=A0ABW0I9U1_9BACT
MNISVNSITTVFYINGLSIDLPTWYLQMHGHQLEEAVIKAYPALNKYKMKGKDELIMIDEKEVSVNTKLKEEVVKKVFDDLPNLIPVDILDLLQGLHN